MLASDRNELGGLGGVVRPKPLAASAERDAALFFSNETATTEIYTLSLHDALPIPTLAPWASGEWQSRRLAFLHVRLLASSPRSEEHTSELQSRGHLVCRLLLE